MTLEVYSVNPRVTSILHWMIGNAMEHMEHICVTMDVCFLAMLLSYANNKGVDQTVYLCSLVDTLVVRFLGDLKKMQQKCDIGGQISKLLYHYLFYIILTREHQNFRNKYWVKNKI